MWSLPSPERPRGFTLIEVMVVIVILGVLAALVVPRVMNRPDEARAVAAKQDLAAVLQALKLYRLDNQRYPSTEQGLQVFGISGVKRIGTAAHVLVVDRMQLGAVGRCVKKVGR